MYNEHLFRFVFFHNPSKWNAHVIKMIVDLEGEQEGIGAVKVFASIVTKLSAGRGRGSGSAKRYDIGVSFKKKIKKWHSTERS